MDNKDYGIRASGLYATYRGIEYFSHDLGKRIRLLSDDDPPHPGFSASTKYWAQTESVVDKSDVQGLRRVQTTGTWCGHEFEVGVIVGENAFVTYLGRDLDVVSRLPGMQRPDKYEVIGEVPAAELTNISEQVVELPSGGTPDTTAARGSE